MIYIEIYTKKHCPYCNRAKELFIKKSLNFIEIPIKNNKKDNKYIEMHKRSGCNTVPQIFINGMHIGGSDDLYNLNNQGKLDEILIDIKKMHTK